MSPTIVRFTPGRIALALLLAIACSMPAWAQATMRADTDSGGPAPEAVVHLIKTNDSTTKMFGTLDAGNNSSQIFKILNDGTYVALGPVIVGNDLEGLDISPLTGDMYAVTNSGAFSGDLWKVDKNTGALTLIGQTGLNDMISASFHPVTGEFWVYQHLGGLYTLNLTTAAATFQFTPVGTGVFKTWEGLAWDNTGTYLYGQDRERLYRWDPITHNTAILCLNLSPSGEGLDFAPDGTLYGGLDPNDPANLRIYVLDTVACTETPSGFNLPMGDIESIAFEKPKEPCSGAIGDFVWDDRNGNGIQDFGEPGFENVTVILKTAADQVITTTTTNAQGLYMFPGLCRGTYKVVVDVSTLPPGGYVPTICNAGSDDTVDNNCSPATVTLPTDTSVNTTIDFGYSCGCTDTSLCTDDTCDPQQGCMHTDIDCNDNDQCTVDSCNPAHGCVHTPIDTDDNNLCTIDSCDRETGVHHEPLNCDNGNACNTDGCDPASGCTHTVIDCNDSNKCTNDSCNPATGCVNTPISCDDANACSKDACDPASGCSHTVIDCSDGTVCTNDSCDPVNGCMNTPVSCDDVNACTADSCDPQSGCRHVLQNCGDDDSCTIDGCNPQTGCTHDNPSCDDDNPCTDDHCDGRGGCTHPPTNTDDGNACTDDSCDPQTGVHHTPRDCNDNSDCTNDGCDPTAGCINTPIGCDDGNPCTVDTCDNHGGCHHATISCDDNNVCTTDSCDPTSGCVNAPIDCDDDDQCTVDACDTHSGCTHVPAVPTPEECRIPCRITGGGQTPLDPSSPDNGSPDKATFGGQVGAPIGRAGCWGDYNQIRGSWNHQRHAAGGHFHAKDFNSLICTCDGSLVDGNCIGDGPAPPAAPANKICFTGVGDFRDDTMHQTVRAAFRTEIEDRGEPGVNDVYTIRIWIPSGGEDADVLAAQACCTIPNTALDIRQPNIVDGGQIIGGNLQIHRALKASF